MHRSRPSPAVAARPPHLRPRLTGFRRAGAHPRAWRHAFRLFRLDVFLIPVLVLLPPTWSPEVARRVEDVHQHFAVAAPSAVGEPARERRGPGGAGVSVPQGEPHRAIAAELAEHPVHITGQAFAIMGCDQLTG